MGILVPLGFILLGFIFGYFLQPIISIVLSLMSIWLAKKWLGKAREAERALALGFMIWVILMNVSMLITWYILNNKMFVQDFFRNYILR